MKKMNKYSNGKIYIIRSPNTDRVYIGCTARSLRKRMNDHSLRRGNCSSIEVIKTGGAYIELLENYPCDNRAQLEEREKHYMKFYYNICVNWMNSTTLLEIKNERNNYLIRDEARYKYLKSLGPINPDELD